MVVFENIETARGDLEVPGPRLPHHVSPVHRDRLPTFRGNPPVAPKKARMHHEEEEDGPLLDLPGENVPYAGRGREAPVMDNGVLRSTRHLEHRGAKLQKERGCNVGWQTGAWDGVGARRVDQDRAHWRDPDTSLVVDFWLALRQGVFSLDRKDVRQPFAHLPFPNLDRKRNRHQKISRRFTAGTRKQPSV